MLTKERVRLYEQLGGSRPAISQAATLSKDLSLSVQNGSPIDLDTAKRVRVPIEDHHRSANPINCGPLLRNGMRIEKAQMHGNMSICITLEYRERPFAKQHLL